MLVIHPKDKTTAMLSALYNGLEAQVVADCRTTKEMGHLLYHVSTQERIMLLGHGSDKGLFFRKDDSKEGFDKSSWGILTLIICASMEATLWLYGAMLTNSHVQKVCMGCSRE